ncbi:MAG TPA: class E sortase [Gaiellaceae bacterium]|nr:class E sortase [Gaiellaceae bacterium]
MARLGLVSACAGVAILLWAGTVWIWQDPFTALYTTYEQHRLAGQYAGRAATFNVPTHGATDTARLAAIAAAARRYRLESHPGEAMGTIDVSRLGLHHMVLVDGTDESSLEKGPGIYRGDYLPGEHELVYIAGHRTTFLAPFAQINELRPGDRIAIAMPYGRFVYQVTGSRIVAATDLAVLQTKQHDELVLQACHPRFFATHRYLAYAKLVEVAPTGARPITGPILSQA